MGGEKRINVNIRLLINAIIKKTPETTLTLVVVLGSSKLAPIAINNVAHRKTKQPTLNRILFSPL